MDAFEPYETYSMAVLWNMSAQTAHDAPVDGDALARSNWQTLSIQRQWERLTPCQVQKIRDNHHEVDRDSRS
ncbi:hypothetical protein MAGGIE_24 [Arthrobacter phage Maggie]|uniref:Uncharacterized protein n=22 Tax=Decurrovirus decurro TaxID=1982105 RepID=A0A345M4I6_9CAUD|nr:hypothetical protein SEA_JESSICA_25 [Arthrobacter phage Jessica]ALF00868.1 hypothetical protein SEA_SANDMAN_24 [Arthrobacter phage Sandman]ALJ97708.1 hypothetical protein SEA_TYMABREU_24 [Arthrobacter phage TymAbreu]ALY09650.1 hypothetical protein MAGGIE_24 [Arthrobacter phage Maggie]ALY09754.1 hypothetical protein MOLOCH_24 [Arthrobacter phage Moloch]ALY10453.1 hypothetical protein STRATUS_24 [Arthrobacter phage Stratus]ANZ52289.1 hypothetical protein SEA_COURTNEY3_24 [Arthrobacter phage 